MTGVASSMRMMNEEPFGPLAMIETGMLMINHLGLALPEIPFGGVEDSGYGSKGGSEAIEAYLTPKLVTQMAR